MVRRSGRASPQAKGWNARQRLAIRPRPDRLWLLAGTALITGAVMWPSHPALAACTVGAPVTGTSFTCAGLPTDTTPRVFTPDESTNFTVTIGEGPDGLNGGIQVPAGTPGAALTIDGVNNDQVGTVDIFDGSMLESRDSTGSDGLVVIDISRLALTVHGSDSDPVNPADAAGYILGTDDGFSYTMSGAVTVTNNGAIIGIGGSGVHFQDVFGEISISNGGGQDDDDVFAGGVIAGGVDGIRINNVFAQFGDGIIVDNSGYWTEDTLPGDDVVDGATQRDGGLIFGATGNGIDITDFTANQFVSIYNVNTNDSVAIADPTDSFLLPTISGQTVTAGIWGDEYGIYIDAETEDPGDSGLAVTIANQNGLIVGADKDGIYIEDIAGSPINMSIQIGNGNGGVITGGPNGSGIDIRSSSTGVLIDNGAAPPGSLDDFELYGPDAVGEDGAGFAKGGTIFGTDSGIGLQDIGFGVQINNANGGIWGFGTVATSAGIYIDNVIASDLREDGNVFIASGWLGQNSQLWDDTPYIDPFAPIDAGGIVFGVSEAVVVNAAATAGIYNGQGGFILGAGFTQEQGTFAPVIYLNTSNVGGLGEDGVFVNGELEVDTWNLASSQVVNYGLMSSYFLPHLDVQFEGGGNTYSPGRIPELLFDEASFRDDLDGLTSFIWNGGSKSLLDGFISPDSSAAQGDRSATYAFAASSWLLASIDTLPDDFEGPPGAVDLYNFDTIFGRITAEGINAGPEFGGSVGNLVQNEGLWIVQDFVEATEPTEGFSAWLFSDPQAGAPDIPDGLDLIVNNGLVQTAVDPEAEELASFLMDAFVQGSSYLKYEAFYGAEDAPPLPDIRPRTGVLSMVDGRGGDQVDIYGLFVGAKDAVFGQLENDDAADGFKSYVAMDVFLQDGINYDIATGGERAADFLRIREDGDDEANLFGAGVDGTTGIIIRKVNEEPIPVDPNYLPNFIRLVQNDGETYGEDCLDQWCKEGDVFFIAEQSDGYFESADGTGFIADGLKAWGMTQQINFAEFGAEDTILETVSEFASPGAMNAPKVASGVLNIADDIFDVVSDHNYGDQFRPAGGSGADLPVDAPVYDAPGAMGGQQTGLWAKVTGSRTDRDSDLTENGFTFETDYKQNIYTVLGGGDFKWSPDSPVRLGLFGGYVNSSMDFDLGDGEVDYEGGVVGTYLAYNDGAFYVDGTAKAEFLSNDYSFDGIDVSADSVAVGISANTGYRFMIGPSFIEPLASIRYVNASVDDFDTTDGSVDYDDADSLRVGAGARIGTAFATGGATTQLSLLGRVWNEFDGEPEVTVDNGIDSFSYTDDLSGPYGEVEGEVLVTSADGTLSGFVSANGKFGDDFTSYGAKAGIRKGF